MLQWSTATVLMLTAFLESIDAQICAIDPETLSISCVVGELAILTVQPTTAQAGLLQLKSGVVKNDVAVFLMDQLLMYE